MPDLRIIYHQCIYKKKKKVWEGGESYLRRDAKKLGLGGRNIIEEVKEKKERRNRQKRSLKDVPKIGTLENQRAR